jgi:hypothetical protein
MMSIACLIFLKMQMDFEDDLEGTVEDECALVE